MIRNLSIASVGPTGAEVLIDGHDIAHGLTGLTITMGAGQIPDTTRDALVKLGWTPPSEPKGKCTCPADGAEADLCDGCPVAEHTP